MIDTSESIPLEQFIQALTSQLDRAQATMALKARAGLPLTFAVKDLVLDLRTHIEMTNSIIQIRPAGPADPEASTLHLELTTITRPMIEENTDQTILDPDEPSLKEVLGEDLTENERRRLEWAGIHKVSQLRKLQQQSNEEELEKFTHLPINRLRKALKNASRPYVTRISQEGLKSSKGTDGKNTEETPLLKIRGYNLRGRQKPDVRIGGERVALIQADERELIIAPLEHQLSGMLSIETEPGNYMEQEFDISEDKSVIDRPVFTDNSKDLKKRAGDKKIIPPKTEIIKNDLQ